MQIEGDNSKQKQQLVIIINNNQAQKTGNKRMSQKQRPLSSKPISTIPIIIDQGQIESNYQSKYTQYNPHQGRPKLTHIVPELPQFGIKSNSTALLYSKFIVKGLKEDKLSMVRGAYKKNREQVTEACTIQNKRNKINSASIAPSKKTQPQETLLFQQNGDHTHDFQQNDNLATLIRASSAKIFKKSNNKQKVNQSQEKRLLKNKTEANLKTQEQIIRRRPNTAKINNQSQKRYSHIESSQKKQNEYKKLERPSTANHRRTAPINSVKGNYNKSLYGDSQLQQLLVSKLIEKPIKIEYNKGVDHIQRNKQNLSNYSRKTSSIYLTNANIQNLYHKLSQNKKSNTLTQSKKRQVSPKFVCTQEQPKPQQIFVKSDRKIHERKMFEIQKFLQNQLPSKFQIVNKQIRKQQKKLKIAEINQNHQELLSKDLDNKFEQNHEQMNDKSAKACFEDYIRKCQILQYNIASKLKTQQSSSGNNPTLNIHECQKIMSIYRKLEIQQDQKQRQLIIIELKDMIRKLKYFSHKPIEQLEKFFTIPFEIVIFDVDTAIIQYNAHVEHVYIMLNGSALIQNLSYLEGADNIAGLFSDNNPHNKMSVYDGQMFGQPTKLSEKHYKYRVTTLQQSMVIKIRYEDYVKKFFSGAQIQEKLQTLKLIFRLQLNNGTVTQQDLQAISLSIEKIKVPSKSLIYRQGEQFDKVVLFAKGKVAAISQFILNQEKPPLVDMKQIDKNVKYNKDTQMKPNLKENIAQNESGDYEIVSLKKLRKNNLINNQVLMQNRNNIYYYFYKQLKQFVKGDSINWQAICSQSHENTTKKNNFMGNTSQFALNLSKGSLHTLKFSLMSNSDDTQIFLLSKSAFQYLPNNFRKILMKKAKQQCKKNIKIQSQKQLKKWISYKQKLCRQIQKDHKLKYSKYRY